MLGTCGYYISGPMLSTSNALFLGLIRRTMLLFLTFLNFIEVQLTKILKKKVIVKKGKEGVTEMAGVTLCCGLNVCVPP